jgi:hypothetical protein
MNQVGRALVTALYRLAREGFDRLEAVQMRHLGGLAVTAAIASALLTSAWAEERPQLLPTRDVDITYDVTRSQRPKVRERVRWLAGEHLERAESSGRSITIFDRNAHEVTLLIPANRTYRKLDGAPRRRSEPDPDAVLKRGSGAAIAGLSCTEWSWTEDVETHTICATADGVMLRLIVDGLIVIEARTVTYAPQRAALFRVPPDYTPALAPDGGAEP